MDIHVKYTIDMFTTLFLSSLSLGILNLCLCAKLIENIKINNEMSSYGYILFFSILICFAIITCIGVIGQEFGLYIPVDFHITLESIILILVVMLYPFSILCNYLFTRKGN